MGRLPPCQLTCPVEPRPALGLQRTVGLPERQLPASASAVCGQHCWRRWAAACSAPLLPRALLNTKNNELSIYNTRSHANRVHWGVSNKSIIQRSWRHITWVETEAVPQPLLVSVAKRSQPLSSQQHGHITHHRKAAVAAPAGLPVDAASAAAELADTRAACFCVRMMSFRSRAPVEDARRSSGVFSR